MGVHVFVLPTDVLWFPSGGLCGLCNWLGGGVLRVLRMTVLKKKRVRTNGGARGE